MVIVNLYPNPVGSKKKRKNGKQNEKQNEKQNGKLNLVNNIINIQYFYQFILILI